MSASQLATLVAFLAAGVLLFAQNSGDGPVTDYRIGPQDVLTITSYDQADLSGKFTVEADGTLLFEQAVRMDLEGIVCKRKDSPYHVTEKPSRHWIKVKNPKYSQLEARQELFEC